MKPYYQTELGTLYHGDCLDILPEIGEVDLVITSPPYDDLRTYKGYSFDFESTARVLYSNVSEGGVVVWVVGDATINGSETGTSFQQALFFKEVGFNLHDTMIWDKGNCRYPETNRYYPCFEYMFILSKGKPAIVNLINDRKNFYTGVKVARAKSMRKVGGEVIENSAYRNDLDRRVKDYGVRFNIWKMPPSSSQEDKLALVHPASFPDKLAQDHIISWSNEGSTVLDPFFGSGTTGVACERLGRRWIGIEISKEYCDIAVKRIEAERAQLKLL